MVPRRHRARFFSRAALHGLSHLTLRKHKAPPLRYAFLILMTLGGLAGWSFGGGQWMASLNPALRMHFHLFTPTLDAWIAPPDYSGSSPIIVATPAGARFGDSVINVPAGSTFIAHLAGDEGGAPTLLANGKESAFADDPNGGFQIAEPIRNGDTISIRRGWQNLDSWHIRVMPDQPPRVAFTEPPSITDHNTVQLSYEASDIYGIAEITARIAPVNPPPRAENAGVEIPLARSGAKNIHRIDFEDLAAYPWAGKPVRIQLIATNMAGSIGHSAPVTFTVPERVFSNTIARALIEERNRLLKNPDDENARNEAADVMAGIAHIPAAYQGDPVALMALRSGAVRLVLAHDPNVISSVSDLLWQSAVRIEDGPAGIAQQRLREVQKELADALDRQASAAEVQGLVDRMREALATYISALSLRSPYASSENVSQAASFRTNMLAPADIGKIFDNIRNLSLSGDSDAAHEELMKLNRKLENLQIPAAFFSEEMRLRTHKLIYPAGAHDSAEHVPAGF